MDAKPRFPFHSKVYVRSKRPNTKEIHGRLGCVAGITEQPDENGYFGYGILVYDFGQVWCCEEGELESTGVVDFESVKRNEEQTKRLAQKEFDRLE